MPVDFEQLRDRASHWLEPIPGASPGGAPAKLEPTYQSIASEVAKLDLPAGGAIDWKKVAEGSGDLLCTRTKDLVLASYLAHALHVTRGIDGLTTGVTFLAEMLDRFWDTLHPEAKRLRGRANALQWFLEKTALMLPDGVLASTEAPKVEALETAALHSGHFKPALLALMTVVPFLPLPREVLREIVELKLAQLGRRLGESHRIAATFAPELLDSLTDRCNDPETGARNVDHVLRGSLMPKLSRALLEKLTAGENPTRLGVGIDATGEFELELQV